MAKPDADPTVTRRQADNVRAAIQTKQIVNRLQDHVDGRVELTPAQVRSAGTLLAKVLPDMSQVTQINEDPTGGKTERELIDAIPEKEAAELLRLLLKRVPGEMARKMVEETGGK